MDVHQAAETLRSWLDDEDNVERFVSARHMLRPVLGLVEAIPPDRLNDWHTVTVHSTGWHMAHPITCALDDCAFDGLAQAEWTEAPTAEGVWQWHDFEDEPWDWTEAPSRKADEDG